MDTTELWGKGWSLRPEQDPRTMEFLGTITKGGTVYTYYRDDSGKILYDSELIGSKEPWMIRADKAARRHRIHN